METLLRELRQVLSHQQALYGPFLPLGRPLPAAVEPVAEPVVVSVSTPTSSLPEALVPVDAAAPMPTLDLFGQPVILVQEPARSPYERIAALIPPTSPLHGMATLAEVEAYVRDTVLIPLDRTRTNPVFGVGNPEAGLMVIGEAPGADEDRQGEPFVGRAGQLLNKILDAAGFPRPTVYIANVLKSRPPNNRDPEPEEVAAHLPLLYKQIALIRPRLLLCVGRVSANALLGRQASLAQLRGTFHDFHGLPLRVTYHPAALLRNEQWKRPTWEDMKQVRARYDELTPH